MEKFANILETVGHTPVIRINKLAPKGINLFVKNEAFNPSPLEILAGLLMKVGRDTFHRNCKFAAQPFRRESKLGLTTQLCGNASFDELGAKAAMLRFDNRRPALFKPLDAQNLPVVVGAYRLPLNFNAASGDG